MPTARDSNDFPCAVSTERGPRIVSRRSPTLAPIHGHALDPPPAIDNRYPCLCCGYLTRRTLVLGDHGVCEVCDWEDDAAQFRDPTLSGGANSPNLTKARDHFEISGAITDAAVRNRRAPERAEEPRYNWSIDPNRYRPWLLNAE
jgi:hypothetical protein